MQTSSTRLIFQHLKPSEVRPLVVVPDFWNQHFDTPLPEGKVDFRNLLPSISLEGGAVNNRFILAYE